MNPIYMIDSYKLSHREQYPKGTKVVYSNFTPRGDCLFNSPEKDGKMIAFGYQSFIKNFLVDMFNENFFALSEDAAVLPFKKEVEEHLGTEYNVDHIRDLHKLGYLPLEIKTLDEGSLVPMKVPVLTIKNTKPEFFWLVNYLETVMSAEMWKPATAATTAFHYRKIVESFAQETCDDKSHVPFQCHDFSARGLSGAWDAASTGMGHLTSFMGTDSVNALPHVRHVYGDEGFIAGSIPATEHSVACANIALEIHEIKDENNTQQDISEDDYQALGEKNFLKRLLTEVYPSGLFSYVSDTYDYWRLLTEIAPSLKEDIMSRDGKIVFRPDSGSPEDIICGTLKDVNDYTSKVTTLEEALEWAKETLEDKTYDKTPHGEHGESNPTDIFIFQGKYYKITLDILWNCYDKQYYYIDDCEIESCEEFIPSAEHKGSIEVLFEQFGGEVNSKGYKVLDPHVGLIYGDSITLERAKEILQRLKDKGFASSNVVFGVGSFTYQFVTRDTFAHAMKATYIEVEGVGEGIDLFKDPKTGDGGKKSAKGLLRVDSKDGKLALSDSQTWHEEQGGELVTRFLNGHFINKTSLAEIRDRINKHLA